MDTLSVTPISQASHYLTLSFTIAKIARVSVADHPQGKVLGTATFHRSVSSKTTTKTSTSHIPIQLIAHHSVIAKLCVTDALAINPVSCNCAISCLDLTVYVAN